MKIQIEINECDSIVTLDGSNFKFTKREQMFEWLETVVAGQVLCKDCSERALRNSVRDEDRRSLMDSLKSPYKQEVLYGLGSGSGDVIGKNPFQSGSPGLLGGQP